MTTATVDEQKLHDLLGRAIVDFGAVSTAPLVIIGDRLGLYRALASQGPMTSAELATHTETSERYVREWLNAQAASGYVHYDAGSGRYELTPEQALVFADADSPAFIVGAFETTIAAGRILPRLTDAFRMFDQPEKTYSWWDYRMLGFQKNRGLRIDHILVSEALKPSVTACVVDRAPRKNPQPSDHAPVVLTMA